MIFEMRTYLLQPGSVPEVEKRFGEALTERVKVSPLGAFFHTEVGPLNRIYHIWPYDDLQHRTRVRSQSIANWPPKIQEFIVEMESKIVIAAPFCPAFTPRQHGNLYEIRTYTMQPGVTGQVVERWAERDRGEGQVVAIGCRRPHRARSAQPVDPHLAIQGRGRSFPNPRRGSRHRRLAARNPRHVHQAGEHVRRPGVVFAFTLSAAAGRPSPQPSLPARGERGDPWRIGDAPPD